MIVADSMVKCESVDQKTDLLIERMSECVRFVQEYMRDRTPEQHIGDRSVFGVMLKDFPPCIARLSALRESLRIARLNKGPLKWPLQSQRATELRRACLEIYDFHNNFARQVRERGLMHIVNEMQNMIRIEQNLYPKESFLGFTKLKKGGVLIKFMREREDAEGGVKQEVVVVSETAYKTECAVCYEREREVVLYPCTHCCLCVQCKESVFRCPICRGGIEEYRLLGVVQAEEGKFILSSQFPECEGHMARLLDQLQRLA
jgi:hypothetical protein